VRAQSSTGICQIFCFYFAFDALRQCWTSWQELPTYGYWLVAAAADSLLAAAVPDHSGSIAPPAGSDLRSQLLLQVTWSGVGGPPENPDPRVTTASQCQPLATSQLQKPVAIQRDITAALAADQHCLEVPRCREPRGGLIQLLSEGVRSLTQWSPCIPRLHSTTGRLTSLERRIWDSVLMLSLALVPNRLG